jgi:hypothetical protein
MQYIDTKKQRNVLFFQRKIKINQRKNKIFLCFIFSNERYFSKMLNDSGFIFVKKMKKSTFMVEFQKRNIIFAK